jgi:hypothetical protein
VTQFFEGETFAWILDTASYRSTSPNERDFHVLAGIEMSAMFHRVNQNLLESKNDMVFLSFGNARVSDPVQELDQAIRSSKVTPSRQADPLGRPEKDFDAVVPTGLCHGRTHHFGELGSVEWSREITERSLTHGRNDVARGKFIGEDNQADMRASASDFAKKLNVLRNAGFPPGNDQIEWFRPRKREKLLIVGHALDAPSLAGQDVRKQFVDFAAGCH